MISSNNNNKFKASFDFCSTNPLLFACLSVDLALLLLLVALLLTTEPRGSSLYSSPSSSLLSPHQSPGSVLHAGQQSKAQHYPQCFTHQSPVNVSRAGQQAKTQHYPQRFTHQSRVQISRACLQSNAQHFPQHYSDAIIAQRTIHRWLIVH